MSKLYPKEKIIVSACLLGEYCRYDGQTKEDEKLLAWLDDYEVISFCPEAPVLGTPRPAIAIIDEENGYRLRRSGDNEDVTDLIVEQTQKAINDHSGVKRAILKSKSPSCGSQTTPIYNQEGLEIALDDGMAASLMKRSFYTIRDENNYKDLKKEKND